MKLIQVENKFGKEYYNKIINSNHFKNIAEVSELDITISLHEVLKREINEKNKQSD
jgi:hypothetical protein